jgi:ABC-type multidrug transport system fused ATPase/permease subunit
MRKLIFVAFFILMAIYCYARQVDASNSSIANALPGDYIIRSNGDKVVLKQTDIDYARRQLGLNTVKTNQSSQKTSRNVSSKMDPFLTLVLTVIGVIILVIWIEWNIGKAIGKCLSKETGVVLGVILIVLAVPIFIGIPIIIYSKGPKIYRST